MNQIPSYYCCSLMEFALKVKQEEYLLSQDKRDNLSPCDANCHAKYTIQNKCQDCWPEALKRKNSPNRNIPVGPDGIHSLHFRGFTDDLVTVGLFMVKKSWANQVHKYQHTACLTTCRPMVLAMLQQTLHRLTQMQMLTLSLFHG